MKTSLAILTAVCTLATGCVFRSRDGVRAGDPLDAQFFVSWTTEDAVTGNTVDCRAIGADSVRVRARNAGTGDVTVDLFDCRDTEGTTYDLTAGDYYITVDLVDCRGSSACTDPNVLSKAEALGPYGVWDDGELDLGHFVLTID